MECLLKGVDSVVFVLDAVDGVRPLAKKFWNLVRAAGLPSIIVVNKVDRDRADFQMALDGLSGLNVKPVVLQLPIRQGESFVGVADVLTGKARMVRDLAREDDLTIVCGRYEGIDARLLQLFPLEPVSVGDIVLNGGESAALSVLEAVARLIPGFMGKEESGDDESFSHGLLEYPHYTRPESLEGLSVPEVLQSGDHGTAGLQLAQRQA